MNTYQQLLHALTEQSTKLAREDKTISAIRLTIALAVALLVYQGYQTELQTFYAAAVLCVIAFFLLIRRHRSIRCTHALVQAKLQINADELAYIDDNHLVFDNGAEFEDHGHPYSYDLDFFGDQSLFQTLNRTGTVPGRTLLAHALKTPLLDKDTVLEAQEVVKELKQNIGWRQQLLALTKVYPDSSESYDRLLSWAEKEPSNLHKIIRVAAFVLPALTLLFFGAYLFDLIEIAGRLTGLLVLINLGVLGGHFSLIKEELTATTKIEKILKQYSMLLQEIENHTFTSRKLLLLQSKLSSKSIKASGAIHELALLFGRLEHVTNAFAGPILNGLLLYHLHVLQGLSSWRKRHAEHIKDWLNVIGEVETFSSLATFSFNNPAFEFPDINTDQKIHFQELGHPLIPKQKSITNSISFDNERFFILTGSNMSGKSTFLRTVGVNMILASIGAPVYAKKSSVHPLPVFVSMRLSDSLSDSESYFYAEVKRLKYIMDHLDKEPCFVLLDEILRGTNSDDKQDGTMEVIRKMASKKAFGGIATHDLEVCNVANDYPELLINKRFEVAIIDDELVFDYTLQDGICQNKSASFIMKKMGVI